MALNVRWRFCCLLSEESFGGESLEVTRLSAKCYRSRPRPVTLLPLSSLVGLSLRAAIWVSRRLTRWLCVCCAVSKRERMQRMTASVKPLGCPSQEQSQARRSQGVRPAALAVDQWERPHGAEFRGLLGPRSLWLLWLLQAPPSVAASHCFCCSPSPPSSLGRPDVGQHVLHTFAKHFISGSTAIRHRNVPLASVPCSLPYYLNYLSVAAPALNEAAYARLSKRGPQVTTAANTSGYAHGILLPCRARSRKNYRKK